MAQDTTPEIAPDFKVKADQVNADGTGTTYHPNGQVSSITTTNGAGSHQMATWDKSGKCTGFGIV